MSTKHFAVAAFATLCACTAPVSSSPTGVSNATAPKADNAAPYDLAYAGYDIALPYAPDMALPVSQSCGAITSTGTCVGNLVEFCANGVLETQDCSISGGTCSVGAFGPACTTGGTTNPPPGGGACGTVTANGICSGNTLEFCDESNMLETVDCTPYGGCFVDPTGFADCAS